MSKYSEDMARALVYDAVASLLPALGKDYNIEVDVKPAGNERLATNVSIVPLTPLGRLLIPHLQANLSAAMRKIAQEQNDERTEQHTEGAAEQPVPEVDAGVAAQPTA